MLPTSPSKHRGHTIQAIRDAGLHILRDHSETACTHFLLDRKHSSPSSPSSSSSNLLPCGPRHLVDPHDHRMMLMTGSAPSFHNNETPTAKSARRRPQPRHQRAILFRRFLSLFLGLLFGWLYGARTATICDAAAHIVGLGALAAHITHTHTISRIHNTQLHHQSRPCGQIPSPSSS